MRVCLRIRAVAVEFDWEFSGKQFDIGRDPDCQLSFVAVDEDAVSWQHAKVVLYQDGLEIRDLGSTKGTFVNGRRIEADTALQVGDIVLLSLRGPRLEVVEYVNPFADNSPTCAVGSSASSIATVTAKPRFIKKPVRARAVTAVAAPKTSRRNRIALNTLNAFIALGAVIGIAMGCFVANTMREEAPPTVKVPCDIQPLPQAIGFPSCAGSAPSSPSPPPSPRLTVEQIVEQNKSSVVWIGVQHEVDASTRQMVRFRSCSGWAVGPRHVVTTAMNARQLSSLISDQTYAVKGQLVVCQGTDDQASDKNCYRVVREIRIHDRYRPEAGDDSSMNFNVAVLVLEDSLPQWCKIVGDDDMKSIATQDSGGCVVYGHSLGWDLQLKRESMSSVSRFKTEAVLSEPATTENSVRYPLRDLKPTQLPPDASGSPVFDLRGKVIGTLTQIGGRNIVISAQILCELLRSHDQSNLLTTRE